MIPVLSLTVNFGFVARFNVLDDDKILYFSAKLQRIIRSNIDINQFTCVGKAFTKVAINTTKNTSY